MARILSISNKIYYYEKTSYTTDSGFGIVAWFVC